MVDNQSRPNPGRKGTVAVAAAIAVLAVVVGVVGAFGLKHLKPPAASQPLAAPVRSCETWRLAVALADGQPQDQIVEATYCKPSIPTQEVDVFTSGASYTHTYWDWQQAQLSIVDRVLTKGRSALIYDRIGSGASTKPHSSKVTLDTDAYVLNQLIGKLHREFHYTKVTSWAHSYGAAVVVAQAAKPGNEPVQAVVLTGFLHNTRSPVVASNNHMANQDPKFKDQGLDDGYLTSKPNTRKGSFYSPNVDPATIESIVEADELGKDVISKPAFIGYAAQQGMPASQQGAPTNQQGTPVKSNPSTALSMNVVVVIGQDDAIFCTDPSKLNCQDDAAVTAFERPYYTKAAYFGVISVPKTGHDLALSPATARDTFEDINSCLEHTNC